MISEAEKNRVLEELRLRKRNLEETLDHYSKTLIPPPRNIEDRASFITTQLVVQSNHKATKEMLEAVNASLARLDDGTWGSCVECKEEISEDRRAAMCWVSRCRPCQEKKGVKIN